MEIQSIHVVLATLLSTTAVDLDHGRELRQAGKLQEAIGFFQDSLASEPSSLEAQRDLDHCLVLAERYREAIEAYENLAASQDPRWQLEAAKWTGLAYLYLGNIEAHIDHSRLERQLAVQLGDGTAAARAARQLGHVYGELEQFGEANDAFIAALEQDPNDLDTLYLLGVMAARQGDWGSLRYQVLDLEPMRARYRHPELTHHIDHLKAELALARGDAAEAHELLDETSDPMGILYREALARAYRHRNDLQQAETTYQSILQATDERLAFPLSYVKALLGLAEVLDAQGRREEATDFFRRFLQHWGDAGDSLPGVVEARSRLRELVGP